MTRDRPATQAEILRLLREGWELGLDHYGHEPWLQKDGLGKGGETRQAHSASFWALKRKGLIELIKDGFPSSRYGLVP